MKFAKVPFVLKSPALHQAVELDKTALVKYTYIENGAGAYLIKDIGSRPGSDRIYAVQPIGTLTSNDRVSLATQESGLIRLIMDDGQELDLPEMKPVYVETADFQ